MNAGPENAGELNYLMTLIVDEYITKQGLRYNTIAEVVGALNGCLTEFNRRVVGPYEDLKIKENGDCYQVGNLSIRSDDRNSAV